MAQQRAISTRELQDVGAANRRGPAGSRVGFQPSESTQNQLQFAKDLQDFGNSLEQGNRRRAAEEEARQAAQKIKDDAEEERLKIRAQRRILESGGQDYKDAHSKITQTGPAGIGSKKVIHLFFIPF